MTYFEKHWNILKHSFKLDEVTLKLILTDIGFMLTVFLSYVLLYFFWVRNLLSVSGLLNMLTTSNIPEGVSGEAIIKSWNHFIANIILIVVLLILLYIIILSIFGALSHKCITKNKLSAKLFLNFIYIYTILTLVYFLLMIAILYLTKDIALLAWGMIFFTTLYLYMLLIFYLVTNDGNLSKIFSHGFRSMLKLHNTLPPIILSFIMLALISFVINIIFGVWLWLLIPLFVLSIIYLSTWVKKYLHHIIHS